MMRLTYSEHHLQVHGGWRNVLGCADEGGHTPRRPGYQGHTATLP